MNKNRTTQNILLIGLILLIRLIPMITKVDLAEEARALAGEELGSTGNQMADFGKVVTRKPKASRAKSREVYLVAGNYHS